MQRTTPFMLLLLAATVAAPVRRAEASPARIARPGAELRPEPGFTAPVIARPAAGSDAELLAADKEWRRVRVGAAEGWVHELFVQALPGAAASSPPSTQAASAPAATQAATPSASMPASATTDERMGLLRAEIAQLRIEVAQWRMRAEGAEAAVAGTEQRMRAVEAERDAAIARAQAVPPAAQASVPEELLSQAREDAYREADRRCAEDLARQVDEALASARESTAAQDQARIDRAVAAERATLTMMHEAEMKSCRQRAAAADEAESLRAQLETEKQAHAADVARIEGEHQKLHDTYVEIVTQRHEDALARERAACDERARLSLLEETRRHDREIRAARKESGWEAEFDKELRAAVKQAVGEAEARWEAKRRGEAYDEQRIRRDEEARVRQACEGERLQAVQAAIAAQSAESEARRRRENEEADLRCQVALEVVLERAAEGGDLSDIREFARERTRRRDAEAAGAPAGAEAETEAGPGTDAAPETKSP